MNYLIDTNSLSNRILSKASELNSLYILQDLLDEEVVSVVQKRRLRRSGIKIVDLDKKHFEKLVTVLNTHGDNLKLIRIYTREGTADVLMISYVLSERERKNTLFPKEWTIVTSDSELIKVAKEYGITCISASTLAARL